MTVLAEVNKTTRRLTSLGHPVVVGAMLTRDVLARGW